MSFVLIRHRQQWCKGTRQALARRWYGSVPAWLRALTATVWRSASQACFSINSVASTRDSSTAALGAQEINSIDRGKTKTLLRHS